jgi:hypothetical protein
MKVSSIKGLGTRDINNFNEPRYPQNDLYGQEIISKTTGPPQVKAEKTKYKKNETIKKN